LAKVSRNELCPCQSGKKYKKCCLNLSKDGMGTNKILNKDRALNKEINLLLLEAELIWEKLLMKVGYALNDSANTVVLQERDSLDDRMQKFIDRAEKIISEKFSPNIRYSENAVSLRQFKSLFDYYLNKVSFDETLDLNWFSFMKIQYAFSKYQPKTAIEELINSKLGDEEKKEFMKWMFFNQLWIENIEDKVELLSIIPLLKINTPLEIILLKFVAHSKLEELHSARKYFEEFDILLDKIYPTEAKELRFYVYYKSLELMHDYEDKEFLIKLVNFCLNFILENQKIMVKGDFLTNITAIYGDLGFFEKIYELEELVLKYNHILSLNNLSYIFLQAGKFEKSIVYAKSSLSLELDWKPLYFLSAANYANKNFTDAYHYAIELIAFFRAKKKGVFPFTSIDNKQVFFTTFQVLLFSGFHNELQEVLNELHISHPNDLNLRMMEATINRHEEIDGKSEEEKRKLQNKLETTMDLLESEKLLRTKYENFFSKISSRQDFNIRDANETELELFFSKIGKVLDELTSSNANLTEKINKRIPELQIEYPKFDFESCSYLATADILKKEFENTHLDCGVIAIQYGRLLERELYKLFKKKGIRFYKWEWKNNKKNTVKLYFPANETDKHKKDIHNEKERPTLHIYAKIILPSDKEFANSIMIIKDKRNASAHIGHCLIQDIKDIDVLQKPQGWLSHLHGQL